MDVREFFNTIDELNDCIAHTTVENSFDKIVEFYKLTCELGMAKEDVEGFKTSDEAGYIPGKIESLFLFKRSKRARRKHEDFEKAKMSFFKVVGKCLRSRDGHLRAFQDADYVIPDLPSKSNIYFGVVDGSCDYSISNIENPQDKEVKRMIMRVVFRYIKSYDGKFKLSRTYFK